MRAAISFPVRPPMFVTAVTTSAPPSFGLSGFSGDACLTGMYVIFMVTTCLAAFVNGYAAFLNFSGAESVKVVADRVRIPRWWMAPLGTLLACGAVGLLAGFAVPVLGAAAASGLVLYFSCAVTAHLRVGDRQIGGAVLFLLLAAAALSANVAYHDHW
ncbi:DoxX family protein [Kribbella sp. VKM Ac-2568]|uniref:DoxX family protein n=1 Tax=Kribbella sp. VKM Ac-2568 TaxID=2512219 RepID=UPI0018EEC75E|nr:DoxX family protein [Kribbella sp. VKM Ac-2568]